jgi:hypothetical protein
MAMVTQEAMLAVTAETLVDMVEITAPITIWDILVSARVVTSLHQVA